MPDSSRQDSHVALLHRNTDPGVAFVADVKEALPVEYVPDLFVFVQVFGEEGPDFGVVCCAHGVAGHGNRVAVLVLSCRCDCVYVVECCVLPGVDAEGGEVGGREVGAFVWQPLVAFTGIIIRFHLFISFVSLCALILSGTDPETLSKSIRLLKDSVEEEECSMTIEIRVSLRNFQRPMQMQEHVHEVEFATMNGC